MNTCWLSWPTDYRRVDPSRSLTFIPFVLFPVAKDAVMGELVCLLLSSLAQRPPQRIVVAALHTPSSRMFEMLTHILVLTSGGQLAYHGPREQVGEQ